MAKQPVGAGAPGAGLPGGKQVLLAKQEHATSVHAAKDVHWYAQPGAWVP